MSGKLTLTSKCQTERAKKKSLQGLFSTNAIRTFEVFICEAPTILGRLYNKNFLDVKVST